ncbi:c-type cytochrome [Actibacterium ureilyticum]|uniref:c-type cytochrome n=1 Tax=Actibacterium ureilyticum TaxID=1590614 RepID=UPI000BAB1003|nr:c-type cytochrome [Actibacterium ureilyticum]
MALLWAIVPMAGQADERLVRLHAPDSLIETGLFQHILPRFSLKTQIRVVLDPVPQQADVVLGDAGRPLFQGLGQTWHLSLRDRDHTGSARFDTWLRSDVGQRTILGFAPGGQALFAPPDRVATATAPAQMDGDAVIGQQVARDSCARCHVVDPGPGMAGIGSTPSFAVLRSLTDWEARFSAFYALKPHAAFTQITDVTPPFPQESPPPIVPIELTLDQVDAVLAYVAVMQAADLGAPLQHQ